MISQKWINSQILEKVKRQEIYTYLRFYTNLTICLTLTKYYFTFIIIKPDILYKNR